MPTPAPRSAYGSAPAPARTSVPRSLVLILRAMLVLAAAGSLVVLFVILPIAFAAVLASGTAAPGLVLIVGGAALLAFAAALTVHVARRLLAQAVERDTQARRLEDELSEVI